MDVVLAQLALFFIPGIIWASVESGFTPGSRHSGAMFMARAFLFGAVSNAVLYGLYLTAGFSFFDLGVIDQTGILNLNAIFDEFALSVVLALTLSVLWLFAGTHRLMIRMLHRIGATQRFGDSSVWEFLMNADQAPVEYVHVRDTANNVVMCGWVDSFSEDSDLREMLLRDAIVYDLEGTVVSETPYLYVSRERADLWVELPYAERETRRFSKQQAGAIKQIYAGETVKGGHNGLSLITERPDPPFPPKAAEEQKTDPPPDRPRHPTVPPKTPKPPVGGTATPAAGASDPAAPAASDQPPDAPEERPTKVEPPVARAPARRKFR